MTAEALEIQQQPQGTAAYIFSQTAPGPTKPWDWAENLLTAAPTYWLATAGPDGVPHTRPLWGIWQDGEFWFSTQNRSGRFLKLNPHASVTVQSGEDVVVVEGTCTRVVGADGITVLVAGVGTKYNWETSASEEHIHTPFGQSAPVFRLTPERVYGWPGVIGWESATRWDFPRS